MQTVLLIAALLSAGGAPQKKDPAPQTPSRQSVVDAMSDVAPAVQACGGGRERGQAQLRLLFRGADGIVTNTSWEADRSDRFSPGARECILRAARGARVPRFQRETFSISYPFWIR